MPWSCAMAAHPAAHRACLASRAPPAGDAFAAAPAGNRQGIGYATARAAAGRSGRRPDEAEIEEMARLVRRCVTARSHRGLGRECSDDAPAPRERVIVLLSRVIADGTPREVGQSGVVEPTRRRNGRRGDGGVCIGRETPFELAVKGRKAHLQCTLDAATGPFSVARLVAGIRPADC